MRRIGVLVLLAALCAPAAVRAQAAPASPQTFTLEQAIQFAVDHYPTVRAAVEQVNVSVAGVSLAHSTYLPRLDSLWQSNRATVNNIFGQVLPQSVIPAMSGPVLPSTAAQSVWGSAAGALFSWELFDFGLRSAGVTGAEATLASARANEALTRLDVESVVGNAFLAVLAAERAVTAAQADFDRRDILARAVQTLVDNQLRPGAEGSRADADRAAARTRLIQVQEIRTLALAFMTRVLGVTGGGVAIDPSTLLDRTPVTDVGVEGAATHPLAQARESVVAQARAAEDALAHTDLPRVFIQSSVFARGSGANPSGLFAGGANGLGLDRANWAAGIQVLFPNMFDFANLRARKAAAAASGRAAAAQYDEALLTIASQRQAAAAMVQAARAIAANTPVQLAAAQQSESQARARYQAGLASIVEVADAQSLLAQAELQDQLARVDVWRGLLAAAAAQGNLAPFLSLVHSSAGAP